MDSLLWAIILYDSVRGVLILKEGFGKGGLYARSRGRSLVVSSFVEEILHLFNRSWGHSLEEKRV